MSKKPESEYVVCTKDHVHQTFGPIPKGSRWHADNPHVADNPAAFKKEGST